MGSIVILNLFSIFSQGDIGTTMYPLLKIGVGPRAVGLGEAYVGLADDIIASYWNPAGLSALKELQFFVSHHEWFMDIRDEYFIFGLPSWKGYLTMSGVYSKIENVEIWDENNIPLGSENLWSGIFWLAYGQNLRPNLSFGLGVKSLFEDLYEQRFFDIALDLGVKISLNKNLQIGSTIRNLSSRIEIPAEIKLGGCYQGMKNLNLLMDIVIPSDNIPHINCGTEYNPNQFFSLRMGWRSGPYSITELGWLSGFTTSFGIKYSGLKFDYAFVPYGKLGITHRLSLTVGASIIKPMNQLKIVVIDGDTKKPLEASIALGGVKPKYFQTDNLGRVEFKNLKPGTIIINTFVPGYPLNLDSIFIQPEGRFEKTITLYKIKPGILRGLVFDVVSKKPIGANVVYRGMAIGTIGNDSVSGAFVLRDLPPGVYALTVSGQDPQYLPQTCSVIIESGRLTEKEFYLIKKREKILLKGVNFDTGKADLKPEAFPILDEAGRILLDNPDIKVELSGHTDPREIHTAQFPSNWELSLARAESVKEYLVQKFMIAPERLLVRGYADTQPIAPNDTEEGMAKNRRTEFRVIEE